MEIRTILGCSLAAGLLGLAGSLPLLAQCSDAGVCTLGKHSGREEGSLLHHTLGMSYVLGRGSSSDDITYHSLRLEGSFRVGASSLVSFVFPINSQSGPLGTVGGIGDAIITWGQTVVHQEDLELDAQVGARFSSGDANGEPALPQWYQSGLGSNDILIGAGVKVGVFDAALAAQIPFGRSSNVITRLKRGSDLLLRGGYTLETGRLMVHPSLLLIKRLGLSTITNPSVLAVPEFIDVPGSDQTQINILVDGTLELSEMYDLNAGIALPLLKREVNVDGLTRAFTVSIGLSFHF